MTSIVVGVIGPGGGCGRFKQNAWKRELCRECYRPREEHVTNNTTNRTRTNQYQTRPINTNNIPPSQSILKDPSRRKPKSVTVRFHEEETEIIGYGGQLEDSDESEDEEDEEGEDNEDDEEEEEKITQEDADQETALKILTKTNTAFNSVLDNLNGKPRPTTILNLGEEVKGPKLKLIVEPFNSSTRRPFNLSNITPSHTPQNQTPSQPLPDILLPTVPPSPTAGSFVEESEARSGPDSPEAGLNNSVNGMRTNHPPEGGRKVQITRGTVITKSHEHVKNKLYIQRNKPGSELDKTPIPTPKQEFLKSVILTTSEDMEDVEELGVGDRKEPDGRAEDIQPPSTPPPSSTNHSAGLLHTQQPATPPPSSTNHSTGFLHNQPPPSTPSPSSTNSSTGFLHTQQPSTPSPSSTNSSTGFPHAQQPPTPPPPPPPTINSNTSFLHSQQTNNVVTREKEREMDSPVLRPGKRPAPKPPAPPCPSPCPSPSPSPSPSPQHHHVQLLTTPVDPKKKSSGRMKVTLKKLLRLGSNSGPQMGDYRQQSSPRLETELRTRPRPLIVHPIDLNKSAVQVLPCSNSKSDKTSPESPSSPSNLRDTVVSPPVRPPPPPRSESLNLIQRLQQNSSTDDASGVGSAKAERSLSLSQIEQVRITPEPQRESLLPEDDISFCYGSETESDIYSPSTTLQINKTILDEVTKTRSGEEDMEEWNRRLQDNYQAIVTANRNAVSLLNNKHVWSKTGDPGEVLRGRSGGRLCWADFVVPDPTERRILNGISFLAAQHRAQPFTLAVYRQQDTNLPPALAPVYASFKDKLPPYICPNTETNSRHMLMDIAVVKRLKAETLSEWRKRSEGSEAETLLLLDILELVLANPENNYSLRDFIVITRDNSQPSVCYLPAKDGNAGRKNSDEWLKEATKLLVGEDSVAGRIVMSGNHERTDLLKCYLWGPPENERKNGSSQMKLWLELERAKLLEESLRYMSTGSSPPSRVLLHRLEFIANLQPETLTRLLNRLSILLHTSIA